MQISRFKLYCFVFCGFSAWIPSCVAYYFSFHTRAAFCEPGIRTESSPSCKVNLVLLVGALVSSSFYGWSERAFSCNFTDKLFPVMLTKLQDSVLLVYFKLQVEIM